MNKNFYYYGNLLIMERNDVNIKEHKDLTYAYKDDEDKLYEIVKIEDGKIVAIPFIEEKKPIVESKKETFEELVSKIKSLENDNMEENFKNNEIIPCSIKECNIWLYRIRHIYKLNRKREGYLKYRKRMLRKQAMKGSLDYE